MFFVTFLVFMVLSCGDAARLSTMEKKSASDQDNDGNTAEEKWDAIAGVRPFTTGEEGETRIVGGREAVPHSWPWQILLACVGIPACGGSILDNYWVVTAAHCFKQYPQESYWSVKAGKHDLTIKMEPCQQNSNVAKIFTHVNYSTVTRENDIALVKLQTPLTFSNCVRPIPVWSGDLSSVKTCTVTGWGYISENGPTATRLQEANVTLLDTNTCLKDYSTYFYPSMLCAGQLTGGVDACQGDSGGPLSCYTGTHYALTGLVSWGVGCARPQKPGVYTKVPLYTQWINATMDGHLGDVYMFKDLTGQTQLVPHKDTAENKCGESEVEPCRLDQGYVGLATSASGKLRLVNVTKACPKSWPWQVSLQNENSHYCSGTLIDKHWVLTARHCLAEAGDMVVLGDHDLNSKTLQKVPIQAVYNQPYVGSFPPMYDLTLIYLKGSADLGPLAYPACVHDEQFDQSSSCVTTGWGYTKFLDLSPDILHQAQVNLLPDQTCWSGWGQVFSSNVFICTQPAASSSCLGDAGAPLLCQKNGRYYLAGIMALGIKTCDQKKPAIFTSLSTFQDWIMDIMDNEGQ